MKTIHENNKGANELISIARDLITRRNYISRNKFRIPLETFHTYYFRSIKLISPSIEVGAGCGFVSSYIFGGLGVIDIGTDPDDLMLVRLKNAPNFGCVEKADGLNLPYHNCRFQTYISIHAIDHVPSRKSFLSEASRILKKGGVLAYSDMTPQYVRCVGDDFLERFRSRFIEEPWPPSAHAELLGELGFIDVRIVQFMSVPLARIAFQEFRKELDYPYKLRYYLRMLHDPTYLRELAVYVDEVCGPLFAEEINKPVSEREGFSYFITAVKGSDDDGDREFSRKSTRMQKGLSWQQRKKAMKDFITDNPFTGRVLQLLNLPR